MDEMHSYLTIPIKGLPLGESSFNFVIDGKFFQEFENGQIKDADCSVKVTVARHQTLMDVRCEVGGFVIVECDRCLDDLTLKVDVDRNLTVGFGSVDMDDVESEEDVMIVDNGEGEISLDQFVYDYVCLSLPLVKVHAEGKCNPQMLSYLTQAAGQDASNEMDSPFEGLKELLEKSKKEKK